MYDTRREPNEFIADSLDEARAKAATFFEVDENDLTVVVAADGEIFGAAGRTVIVSMPKNLAARPSRPSGDGGSERGPRRESHGGRDRGEGRGRERGGRETRGRGGRSERGGERGGRERPSAPREQLEPVVPKAVESSKGTAKEKLSELGEFLQGAVELMKLGDFDISESLEGDFLIFQLRGPAADALQSGDGRTTDALQLVVNQVAMRQSDDAPRVVVDVEGGGDERESTMGRLADRAIKRARETGRSVALDPMNSRDRRAIHLAIRDEENVATPYGHGRTDRWCCVLSKMVMQRHRPTSFAPLELRFQRRDSRLPSLIRAAFS